MQFADAVAELYRRKFRKPWLTCFILTPHMDPLTSITNTMFLGRGERFEGAKKWTKCPSETWRRQLWVSLNTLKRYTWMSAGASV